jgi:Transmembrane secretion effector
MLFTLWPARRPGPRRPWTRGLGGALGHRDFALLWSGQTVSVAGDGIFTVALALEALHVDDRPSALSVVLAARLVPTVVLVLAGGVAVDRVPRRLAMLVSDVVRGLAVATVAVLAAKGTLGLTGLIVMSVVFGVADAFFSPATVAVLPELLPAGLIVQGNALSSTSQLFAQQLIGPAVGGIVVAGLPAPPVSWPCAPGRAPPGRSPWGDVRDGLRYCRSQPWLWATIAGAGLANFAIFSPLGVLIPLLVRHVLHQSGIALGVVLAAGGAGGIAATLIVARRGLPRRPVTFMWAGWATAGLAAAALSIAPGIWVLAPLAAVTFGLLMYGNAIWDPLLQRLVPHQLLGRASSIDWLASFSLSPLGIIAAGALATVIGTRATLVSGGALAVIAGLCVLIPGARDPDRQARTDRVTAVGEYPADADVHRPPGPTPATRRSASSSY